MKTLGLKEAEESTARLHAWIEIYEECKQGKLDRAADLVHEVHLNENLLARFCAAIGHESADPHKHLYQELRGYIIQRFKAVFAKAKADEDVLNNVIQALRAFSAFVCLQLDSEAKVQVITSLSQDLGLVSGDMEACVKRAGEVCAQKCRDGELEYSLTIYELGQAELSLSSIGLDEEQVFAWRHEYMLRTCRRACVKAILKMDSDRYPPPEFIREVMKYMVTVESTEIVPWFNRPDGIRIEELPEMLRVVPQAIANSLRAEETLKDIS